MRRSLLYAVWNSESCDALTNVHAKASGLNYSEHDGSLRMVYPRDLMVKSL